MRLFLALALCCGRGSAHSSSLEDWKNWHKPGADGIDSDSKGCLWVADLVPKRCAVVGHDGVLARDACPACQWHRLDAPNKNCDWVADSPWDRCELIGFDGRVAYDVCEVCGTTPAPRLVPEDIITPMPSFPEDIITPMPSFRPTNRPTTARPTPARPTALPTFRPTYEVYERQFPTRAPTPKAKKPLVYDIELSNIAKYSGKPEENAVLTRAIKKTLGVSLAQSFKIDCCTELRANTPYLRRVLQSGDTLSRVLEFVMTAIDSDGATEEEKVEVDEALAALAFEALEQNIQGTAMDAEVDSLANAEVDDVKRDGTDDPRDDDNNRNHCTDAFQKRHESSAACIGFSIVEVMAILLLIYLGLNILCATCSLLCICCTEGPGGAQRRAKDMVGHSTSLLKGVATHLTGVDFNGQPEGNAGEAQTAASDTAAQTKPPTCASYCCPWAGGGAGAGPDSGHAETAAPSVGAPDKSEGASKQSSEEIRAQTHSVAVAAMFEQLKRKDDEIDDLKSRLEAGDVPGATAETAEAAARKKAERQKEAERRRLGAERARLEAERLAAERARREAERLEAERLEAKRLAREEELKKNGKSEFEFGSKHNEMVRGLDAAIKSSVETAAGLLGAELESDDTFNEPGRWYTFGMPTNVTSYQTRFILDTKVIPSEFKKEFKRAFMANGIGNYQADVWPKNF